jgi:predicted permease
VLGEEATTNLFAVLGVSAAMGRVFGPDEDDPGRRRVVILSDAFWRAKFSGDHAVLGRTLTLDGQPHVVIGVMPPEFRGLSEHGSGYAIDFFVPSAFDDGAGTRGIGVVGRLKPDVSIDRARDELRRMSEELRRRRPDTHRDVVAAIAPMHDEIVRPVRTSLFVMLGAVGLVLLIACVNLGNLLIVRAMGQGREIAIRLAIGATRARITIDLALRGLILGVLGGAAGLVCGLWTRGVLVSLAPVTMPRMDHVPLNPRVLAVTFALAAITGIIAGLLPAAPLWRGHVAQTLRASALTTTGVRSVARWRGALMAAEIAAALMLAVGAGLLVQSLIRLANVDLGFHSRGVLLFTVRPPEPKYRDQAARLEFIREVERRVASIPGVASAALANEFPLRGGGFSRVTIAGDAAAPGDSVRTAGFQVVSPRYFATLRIPLVRGRLLSAEDRAGAPAAAVVNETFVRRYLAGRDPIGQRFRRVPRQRVGADAPELTIVGVVRDARRDGPHTDFTPQAYLSAAQPETYPWTQVEEVGVRAEAGDPRRLVPAIQRAVWSIDPAQPIMSVLTLDDVIVGSTAARRFNTTLLSAVAILAFALAIVGVYGVVAHAAAQRTREIGIRMALGAGRGQVLSLVVAGSIQWALLGTVIGLAGAYLCTRVLAALLFGITPTDLATFAGLAALTLSATALASYLPARRAASVNPVSALRAD